MNKEKKISIQNAAKLVQDLVNNDTLTKQFGEYRELFCDTEEWLLFLTAAPSNPAAAAKQFPLTPSDVSRTRKRKPIATIVECEEDEFTSVPADLADPTQQIRRGSRTASKLANLKLREPNLSTKLRRETHSILEAGKTNTTYSEAPHPKRLRNTNCEPKANTSATTAESSFASARDSLTSQRCHRIKDEPMETDDDIIMEKVHSTKISTYDNSQIKSNLRVKTVTVTRSSKRITKQRITTVIDVPATKQQTLHTFSCNQEFESDDDAPIRKLISEPSDADHIRANVPTDDVKSKVKNSKRSSDLTAINGLVPIIQLQDVRLSRKTTEILEPGFKADEPPTTSHIAQQKCMEDVATDRDQTPMETQDAFIVGAPVAKDPATAKLTKSKPKPLNNATNRNTPEAIKNMVNRNFEPVSVKKRVEALEEKIAVEPVLLAKPDVPIRMTRTKTKAMLVSLSAAPPQKMETANLMKLARKSLRKAMEISLAKERKDLDVQRTDKKENTPPPRATNVPQNIHSTSNKNRAVQDSFVHPTRLLAQMATSKQPLVNLSTASTFLQKNKDVSAAEEAEEKRKEERRYRRENKEDALLKKKALIEDKIEQQRKKREEKERNVLIQRALLEQEKAEMISRTEKENEEKARLVQEREENLRKEMLRKKEEAKQKAAKIEERRVKKGEERLQALKLLEEEQKKLQAQKRKEQEDAERLHARRMLEEKERKEKEKEAALKLEKLKEAKKVVQPKALDSTFVVDHPPVLIASSKYDYPLPDLSKGNDSDFSEVDDDDVPNWAHKNELMKILKSMSGVAPRAVHRYFGSKPTTVDLREIFANSRHKPSRSSSAVWKSPPRSSMLPDDL